MSYFRRMIMMAANLVRSCFGGGYWDDGLPWLEDDAWNDGVNK